MYTNETTMNKHYRNFKSLKGEKTDLYLGMELEVYVKELRGLYGKWKTVEERVAYDVIHTKSGAVVLDSFDGDAILKPEHGDGFEIVTLPATLNYHRNKLWNKFFEGTHDLLGGLTDNGNNYGIHVHFSRKAINDRSLAKLLYFYHAPENNKFLTDVAGRLVGPKGCYNLATKKTLVQGDPGSTIVEASLNRGACGVRRNSVYKPTVEVRIFQSTPEKDHVMKCLEFTHSVVEWAKQAGETEPECNSGYYLQWFLTKEKHKYYPYLANCLIKHKYITGDVIATDNIPITPAELAKATRLTKAVEIVRKKVRSKKVAA